MSFLKIFAVVIVLIIMVVWSWMMGLCLADIINTNDEIGATDRDYVAGINNTLRQRREPRFGGFGNMDWEDLGWIELAPDHIILPTAESTVSVPHTAPINAEEEADNSFARLETHNNDSQNVHNHTIMTHIGQKYDRLVTLDMLGPQWLHNFTPVDNAVAQRLDSTCNGIRMHMSRLSVDKQTKMEVYLTEVAKNSTISLRNEIIKEGWILSMVWDRINCAENVPNQANLREMFVAQIMECVKPRDDALDVIEAFLGLGTTQRTSHTTTQYTTVCLNGRVGQLLAVLTNLDADPELATPILDEKELANAAYVAAHSIFEAAMREDPAGAGIYNMNEDDLTDAQAATLEDFKRKISQQIDRKIRKQYIDLLSPDKLQEVINNSQAAIV
jgi:hypothetical protein